MPPPTIGLTLSSRVDWLDVAQSLGEDLAVLVGFDEDARFAVGMALREALNNAILHGNRRDESKQVSIVFVAHDDRLEVSVRDQGAGFDPRGLPDPLAEQNLLKPSGRGIFLMRSYMDEVDLSRAREPGATVRMVKRLLGPRAAPARPV
jgi:serine/threonine-protein kinase RsbW